MGKGCLGLPLTGGGRGRGGGGWGEEGEERGRARRPPRNGSRAGMGDE